MPERRNQAGTGGFDVFRAAPLQPAPRAARLERPVKRSLTIAGHRTSISLEEPFWAALRDVAREKRKSVSSLIFQIDAMRGRTNLSSAIRVYLLEHYRRAPLEER